MPNKCDQFWRKLGRISWRSKAILVNVRERDLLGSYEPVKRMESQTRQSAMSQIITLSCDDETVE